MFLEALTILFLIFWIINAVRTVFYLLFSVESNLFICIFYSNINICKPTRTKFNFKCQKNIKCLDSLYEHISWDYFCIKGMISIIESLFFSLQNAHMGKVRRHSSTLFSYTYIHLPVGKCKPNISKESLLWNK